MEHNHKEVKYFIDDSLVEDLKKYHNIDAHKEIRKIIEQEIEFEEKKNGSPQGN